MAEVNLNHLHTSYAGIVNSFSSATIGDPLNSS